MNVAHIVNQPGVEVGDKALALCGVKWKIAERWEDIPTNRKICRECVDAALHALTAATNQIDSIRTYAEVLALVSLRETAADDLIAKTEAYAEKREAKAIAKAEKKVRKAQKADQTPVAPEENTDE